MKSKEAIRNDIIHYASLTWGTKNINNLNPLIHLMVEEISNELFLLDNKLEDIDSVVLDKLMRNLSPSVYDYIRPSHAILQVKLSVPVYNMGRTNLFFMKEVPQNLKRKGIGAVVYAPVVDVKLHDAGVVCLFQNKTLYMADGSGKRKATLHATKRAKYGTVWFAMEANQALKEINDLSFYIDFPHLRDDHLYYELLKESQWTFDGKPLAMTQGLPVSQDAPPTRVDRDILNFYEDHYFTAPPLNIKKAVRRKLPEELMPLVDAERVNSLPPLYWFSISFPIGFMEEDIEKMVLAVNVFPAINKYPNKVLVADQELNDTVSLPSAFGEEFLEMGEVKDRANTYQPCNVIGGEGTYTIRPVQRKMMDDPRVSDYLERLVDVIYDERTSSPGIEGDKITEVLKAIHSIQDGDTHKVEMNRLSEYSEIGLVTLAPHKEIGSIEVNYWTTHANLLNGITDRLGLTANKVPELTKVDATFFTRPSGGRNFYGLESLKAINRYYLTSKDRILTRNDVINFCKVELGEYIEAVDVVRKAAVGGRSKKGIVTVIEVSLTLAAKQYKNLLQKGTIKDLLIRLRRKSPGNFAYKVKILK